MRSADCLRFKQCADGIEFGPVDRTDHHGAECGVHSIRRHRQRDSGCDE
jgi:hypothetical protein